MLVETQCLSCRRVQRHTYVEIMYGQALCCGKGMVILEHARLAFMYCFNRWKDHDCRLAVQPPVLQA